MAALRLLVHIVIGGAGAVGQKIAEFLGKEGHDIVIIDVDPEACGAAQALDCMVIQGNAAASDILQDAGIAKADVFYAVTSHDEVNLAAAAIAKSHGAHRVIARVNSLDLMQQAESREFRPIGVDVAVSPDLVAATKIVRLIEFPGILEIDAFKVSELRLVEAGVESASPAAGRPVKELGLPKGMNLVAIFRGAEVIIPGGDDVIHRGDHVVVLVETPGLLVQVQETFGGQALLHQSSKAADHIVISGMTGIARRVATMLRDAGRRVTVVARGQRHEEVEALASDLEGILVLEGSSRDVQLWREENISDADVLVAASPHEEFNLITALLARSMGVARTTALVDQPELEDLAERLGVDLAVSPRFAAVSTLLKHASDVGPEELTLLHHGEAQALLVEVEEGNRVAGKLLRDADMPIGSVVGALVRDGDAVVPRGDERIQPGDSLVVFAKADAVSKLADLF